MILKIAVVIYLQFLNETFHNGKNHVLHTLGIISIVEFFVSFTLQFFGFADYANTVFITHILMLIAGVYTSVNVVHTFHKQHKKGGILSLHKPCTINMYPYCNTNCNDRHGTLLCYQFTGRGTF